jgi:hypothetical protein
MKKGKQNPYSLSFKDSTMFNFLILRENIRLTIIDNANVITAVSMKFERDMEGKI